MSQSEVQIRARFRETARSAAKVSFDRWFSHCEENY
jgi:hypothetical protein